MMSLIITVLSYSPIETFDLQLQLLVLRRNQKDD